MRVLGLALMAVAIGFLIVYSPLIFGQVYQVTNPQTGAFNNSEQRETGYGVNDLNMTNSLKGECDSLALFTGATFGIPLGPFAILAFSSVAALISYLILKRGP